MMADKGRGSALIIVVTMVLVLIGLGVAKASVYTVGDGGGWTFNVASWPNGKRFWAGDTLVFNYGPGAHDVVSVGKSGYYSCSASNGVTYSSGSDKIKLVKGANYFICSFPGHCEGGIKIAINAA